MHGDRPRFQQFVQEIVKQDYGLFLILACGQLKLIWLLRKKRVAEAALKLFAFFIWSEQHHGT